MIRIEVPRTSVTEWLCQLPLTAVGSNPDKDFGFFSCRVLPPVKLEIRHVTCVDATLNQTKISKCFYKGYNNTSNLKYVKSALLMLLIRSLYYNIYSTGSLVNFLAAESSFSELLLHVYYEHLVLHEYQIHYKKLSNFLNCVHRLRHCKNTNPHQWCSIDFKSEVIETNT
jgi:hypothetical protein